MESTVGIIIALVIIGLIVVAIPYFSSQASDAEQRRKHGRAEMRQFLREARANDREAEEDEGKAYAERMARRRAREAGIDPEFFRELERQAREERYRERQRQRRIQDVESAIEDETVARFYVEQETPDWWRDPSNPMSPLYPIRHRLGVKD